MGIALVNVEGAWQGRVLVWNPQLQAEVPLGSFENYAIQQNRVEFRLPVGLLQPLMPKGLTEDSFDFYVRVYEVIGGRGVIDFAGHGQALETANPELLELRELLLTESVEQAASRWSDVDPVRAQVAARQARNIMELPTTMFMFGVPLAR